MCWISLLILHSLPSPLSLPIRLPSALLSLLSFLLMSPLLCVIWPWCICVPVFVCCGGVIRGKELLKWSSVSSITIFYNVLTPPELLIASEAGQSLVCDSHSHTLSPSLLKAPEPEGEGDKASIHFYWSFILKAPLSSWLSFCLSHSPFLPCVDRGPVYHSATDSMARFLAFM